MGQRMWVLSADSLLALLQHYTDGYIDLDAKLKNIMMNQHLQRWIGLTIESAHWPDSDRVKDGEGYDPLFLKYEANKLLKWGSKGTPYEWQDKGEGFETPGRQ